MRTNPMPPRAAVASARLHAVLSAPPATPPAAPALAKVPPERAEARALIARLREHLVRRAGEGEDPAPHLPSSRSRRRAEAHPWTLGLPEADRFLPAEGLSASGLHDVVPEAYGDFPAACGFALALAVRRLGDSRERRPVLWCRLETEQREYGSCFGHGIAGLGLPRARFLTLSLRQPMALLWTFEEALKSGCLSVVLADVAVQYADLTATRRLSLAGQAGKTSGIAVLTRNYPGSTASVSRWCVATSRSMPLAAAPDSRAPGPPAWAVSLTRIRGGRPGSWLLNWQKDHASSRFTLVPGFSGGALHPGAAEEAGARAPAQPSLRAG